MPRYAQLLQDIEALTRRELRHGELAQGALRALAEHADLNTCVWTSLDPCTLLPTAMHTQSGQRGRLHAMFDAHGLPARTVMRRFLARDLDADAPLSLQWMVRTRRHAAGYQLETKGAGFLRDRHVRMLAAVRAKDEVRVRLSDGDVTWGLISGVSWAQTFTEDEITALGQLGPVLGAALRLSFLRAAASSPSSSDAPGVVLLDGSNTAQASAGLQELLGDNDEASPVHWSTVIDELSSLRPGERFMLMSKRGPVAAWVTSIGGARAILVEPSRPHVRASVLMTACQLTQRERQVTEAVCRGWSTREIAFELDLADYTVQDHLKRVFDKLGVSSRPELIATLVLKHYLPQQAANATPSPYGWYLNPR